MKLLLIAALLVLALTHGSFAQDAGSRMSEYIENIKAKINHDIQQFVDKQELKDRAETFIEDRQIELEPLSTKIQDQLQDLKDAATNMQDQLKPLADNVRDKMNPLIIDMHKKMESIMQLLGEHAKSTHK